MSLIEENRGNPKESVETAQQVAEDAVFGSPDSFFESLDNDVNGNILDNEPEQVTPLQEDSNTAGADVEQVSPNDEIENLKKRYGDSTREAQRMKAELDELQPFVPLLEAMKTDSGLVDYVRDYFTKGGEVPKNVKEQLKLDEDFEFDTNDFVNDEKSDSRKVFDTMVDSAVNKRVNNVMNNERAKAEEMRKSFEIKKEALAFKERHQLTDDEFQNFVTEAKDHYNKKGLSFEDMYFLMNKDKVKGNIATSTKNDMIQQMKTVRDIPTSQSGSNSAAPKSNNPSDNVFDSLLGMDDNLDNLFG
tara:strand:- start:798 stop:1706 length:909 start_codon:yes stop_codon:yes gene_type:complete